MRNFPNTLLLKGALTTYYRWFQPNHSLSSRSYTWSNSVYHSNKPHHTNRLPLLEGVAHGEEVGGIELVHDVEAHATRERGRAGSRVR